MQQQSRVYNVEIDIDSPKIIIANRYHYRKDMFVFTNIM